MKLFIEVAQLIGILVTIAVLTVLVLDALLPTPFGYIVGGALIGGWFVANKQNLTYLLGRLRDRDR